MTDDLDDLKSLMDQATPRADATRRADNIALARKNFDDIHARATPEMTGGTGLKRIWNIITSKAAIGATTAVFACGFLFFTSGGQSLLIPHTSEPAFAKQVGSADLATETASITMSEANPPLPATPAPEPSAIARTVPPLSHVEGGIAELMSDDTATVARTAPQFDGASNTLAMVLEAPVMAPSIEDDGSSYATIQSALMNGQIPPANTIRVDELINHFDYDYPAPKLDDVPFQTIVTRFPTPWNDDTELLFIVLQGQRPGGNSVTASNVTLQLDIDSDQEAEYRLIGYDALKSRDADLTNNPVDLGEVSSGRSSTVIYEITLTNQMPELGNLLRDDPGTTAEAPDEIGNIKIHYAASDNRTSVPIEISIPAVTSPNTETNFATAIAGFGQLLRGDSQLGDWGYDQAIALAHDNRGTDNFGLRAEAVQLMRLAQSLSR
ncbi:YfbK domain-containing protein [Loktanella sp. S4079]|uniref:YfbK domain-containing protein n=1 Tax=Loktanella sp. S4079 TaxID=579483 RepID=UPI0005FA702A|nr:von Willebrand factor type A domain-containing protein [Loktanella sp. S4079]KJZ19574.1 hypothetical protein TW80_01270 [Loktanella sp. S4079]